MLTKDYTQSPLDRRHGIVPCPRCGRKALARPYRDGSVAYFHKIEYQHGAPVVTDHCMITRKNRDEQACDAAH